MPIQSAVERPRNYDPKTDFDGLDDTNLAHGGLLNPADKSKNPALVSNAPAFFGAVGDGRAAISAPPLGPSSRERTVSLSSYKITNQEEEKPADMASSSSSTRETPAGAEKSFPTGQAKKALTFPLSESLKKLREKQEAENASRKSAAIAQQKSTVIPVYSKTVITRSELPEDKLSRRGFAKHGF